MLTLCRKKLNDLKRPTKQLSKQCLIHSFLESFFLIFGNLWIKEQAVAIVKIQIFLKVKGDAPARSRSLIMFLRTTQRYSVSKFHT